MKLPLMLVLLPSVRAFVVPGASLSCQFGSGPTSAASTRQSSASITPHMAAESNNKDEARWSVNSMWREVVGSASQTKAKVDSTASEVYAELRKKVLVKKERQSLESQLCSLIRIEGGSMSSKAEGQVRRLASELEALQENAAAFGSQRTGLAGCWKLIYSSTCPDGKHSKSSDTLKSIEDISYVSENCRLSHTDTGILRVYKRVPAPARAAALAAAVASGDDTAQSAAASLAGGGSTARASATAAGRVRRKQPARKRMFFGWRR